MFHQFISVTLLLVASTEAFPNPRIVNGTDAQLGEVPYIISLRAYGSHNCGGSILDKLHILTAAHCVVSYPASTLTVQFGVVDISSDNINTVEVQVVTYHQNYSAGSGYLNDVAVLRLAEELPLNDNTIKTTTLPPPRNATPENTPALLSGWGLSSSYGQLMTTLQKVNIIVYSDDACEEAHKSTGPTNRNYHVCAGVPEGGKGQCNGDSGGPLIVNGVQVGIVSWSVKPCTVQGYPGVFTKVSAHVDWILEQVNKP